MVWERLIKLEQEIIEVLNKHLISALLCLCAENITLIAVAGDSNAIFLVI